MKKLIFVFLFAFPIFLFSQNSKTIDSLRSFGKLKEAEIQIQNLIRKKFLNEKIAKNYAEVLAQQNLVDSAFHYLEISVETDSTYLPLCNPLFINLTNTERWSKFVDKQLKKYQEKEGNFKNLDYAKRLIAIRQKDQIYYYEIHLAEKLTGLKSPITNALWKLKEKQNEELLFELEDLISKNGYPKCSENMPCSTPFLIIQHSNLETQEKYLQTIENLCKTKDIPCNHYAMLIDRINVRKGKPQLYGTQFKYNVNGKQELSNLFEPEKLNERRAKLGLQPISH